jgi:outer membrane cobalamin receptor
MRNPTLWLAFALILILAQSSYTSPAVGILTGTVVDTDGVPIPHATVHLVGSAFACECDALGRFMAANLPIGIFSVLISAVGYDSLTASDVRIAEDAPATLSFRMTRRAVPLNGLVVTDSTISLMLSPDVVISRSDIEKSHARSVAEALQEQSGIQVVGNSGTVSIRGSSPEHVVILVDGQRVAPASSGVSTLDGISLENVERIEIHKGGASALAGTDAIGGVIAITTRNPRIITSHDLQSVASSRIGSYDLSRLTAQVTIPEITERLSLSANVTQDGYSGNFPFRYSAPGRTTIFEGNRINNRTHSETWHSSVNWLAGKQTNVRFNGQVYNGLNGLPNRASRQDSSGYRTDHRLMLNAELQSAVLRNGTLTLRSGWSDQTQYFNDSRDPIAANRFESRFTDKAANISAEIEKELWSYTAVRLGGEERFSHINHTDLLRPIASSGKSTRWQSSLWSFVGRRISVKHLHPLEQVTLSTAWRYDRVSTGKDNPSVADTLTDQKGSALSPLYSIAITTAGHVRFTARASYGKSLRIPPVNALFWKGDVRSRGNPYLKPERAEHSEASISGKYEWLRHSIDASLGYSHSHIRDAIVWQPGQGEIWRPENIGSSLTTGHEESATVKLFDELVTLGYQNAVMSARNKTAGANSYDKYLTYSPAYITSFSARLSWRWMWADWRTRLVGQRWANIANTASYDGYRVDDIGVGVNLTLYPALKAAADMRIDNIFDKDFVVVTHYPMPGKQTSISLKLTYGAM